MPEISRFFGIIIYMYFGDHLPPHFHAVYSEHEAMFSIETGEVFKGEFPKAQMRLVQAWVELHREELDKNYKTLSIMNETDFIKIKPLM